MISYHSQQPLLITNLKHQIQNPFSDLNRVIVSNKKLQNINCIFKQNENEGGLYLGDIISTMKQQILKDNNIQAILTCMCEKISVNLKINSHKILTIKDTLDYPIIQHFDEAIAWIQEKRKSKINVLVHCHAGVSRSATIIIAYLIRTKNWNPFQALQFVRQQRQRAKPNASFWNQINEYYNYWNKRKQIPLQEQNNKTSIKQNTSLKSNLQNKLELPKQKPIEKIDQKPYAVTITVQKQKQKFPTKISLRSKLMNKLVGQKLPLQTKRDQITVQNSRKTSLANSFIGFAHHNSVNKQQIHFSQNKSFIQPRPSLTQRKDHNFSPLLSHSIPNSVFVSGFDAARPNIRFT